MTHIEKDILCEFICATYIDHVSKEKIRKAENEL